MRSILIVSCGATCSNSSTRFSKKWSGLVKEISNSEPRCAHHISDQCHSLGAMTNGGLVRT